MSLRALATVGFAMLPIGCVPMTEPIGDIDKAEPAKDLLGKWSWKLLSGDYIAVVDRPEIEGNPKGLMRCRLVYEGEKIDTATPDDAFWFFVATVGKQRYANVLFVKRDKYPNLTRLAQKGDYAKWVADGDCCFVPYLLKLDGDTMTFGETLVAFEKLMKGKKFPTVGDIYQVPKGWLTKYLGDHPDEKVFESGTIAGKATRVK